MYTVSFDGKTVGDKHDRRGAIDLAYRFCRENRVGTVATVTNKRGKKVKAYEKYTKILGIRIVERVRSV